HALFRCGLRMVLAAGIPDLEIAEAASMEEAMRCAMAPPGPALVLLDVQLHGLNGIEGIALVKRRWPQAEVLILSSDADPKTAARALARGASAFVSKAETADAILAVIDRLRRAQPQAPAAGRAPMQADTAPRPLLTPRQYEVLDLVCQGLSNK